MEMGILKLICEFAHSSNLSLRLNSMWALKHLVYSAENEVKTSCLEQLKTGWLVDLISWDEDLDAVGHGHSSDDDDDGMDEDNLDEIQAHEPSNYEDEGRMEDSIGQLSTPFYKNQKLPTSDDSNESPPTNFSRQRIS